MNNTDLVVFKAGRKAHRLPLSLTIAGITPKQIRQRRAKSFHKPLKNR